MQNTPERRGTVVKYSLDGTVSRFFPAEEDNPQANFDALEEACASIVDGDQIVLDEYAVYEKGDEGDGIDISGVDRFRIKNGYLTRDTSISFNYFFKLTGCDSFVIENIVMDGQAGMSLPTTHPLTHQYENANNTDSCNLIYLASCTNGTVRNCQCHDSIANPTWSLGHPRYSGAHGIRVGAGCQGIQIEGCLLKKLGYAGVRDDGVGTRVVDSVFDDCHWHGYVYNGEGEAHLQLENCHFTRINYTSMGYPGGVDINPPTTPARKVYFKNCSTNYPYDVPEPSGGALMVKMNNVIEAVFEGCDFRHGVNGPADNYGGKNSIRLSDSILGSVKIVDTWMAGSVWHVSWDGVPYDVSIENSTINGDSLERWAFLIAPKNLIIKNSEVRYSESAFLQRPDHFPEFGEMSIHSVNTRYIPDDDRDSAIFEYDFIRNSPHRIKFDSTNSIQVSGVDLQEGGSLSFSHAKCDNIIGNLLATTKGDDPTTKLWNSDLTGDQAHTAPSGSLPNGPFFPDVSGAPGLTISNQNWVSYEGSPSGVENVDYWKWDTNLEQFVARL